MRYLWFMVNTGEFLSLSYASLKLREIRTYEGQILLSLYTVYKKEIQKIWSFLGIFTILHIFTQKDQLLRFFRILQIFMVFYKEKQIFFVAMYSSACG